MIGTRPVALSAFHPRGEVEVARAVNARGHIMALSNAASQPIEDVVAAPSGSSSTATPTGAGRWP